MYPHFFVVFPWKIVRLQGKKLQDATKLRKEASNNSCDIFTIFFCFFSDLTFGTVTNNCWICYVYFCISVDSSTDACSTASGHGYVNTCVFIRISRCHLKPRQISQFFCSTGALAFKLLTNQNAQYIQATWLVKSLESQCSQVLQKNRIIC